MSPFARPGRSSLSRTALLAVLVLAPRLAGTQPAPSAQAAAPPVPAALTVPDGFGVSVFASGLTGARLMAVSPEGTLVVARRAEVVALPDTNGDGVAEPRVLFSDMTYAHSVAFANGFLYIATTPAVLRVPWVNGAPSGTPVAIVDLPSDKPSLHTSRSIRIGPDGRLYVTIGSSCNACVEADARRTTMMVYDADGKNGRPYATGLRNAVGFDWDPATRRLYAGDPGIDGLGDDLPSEEVNLVEDGEDYGHPFFNGASQATTLPDLKGASGPPASRVKTPAIELPAHATPMGVAFYTGSRFPEPYRSSLYVALHGSSTRTSKSGYKVVRLVMENGRPARVEDFVTGFLSGDVVSGRPVGLVTGGDGALYVSDDNKGFIYRVFARSRPAGAAARELVSHRVSAAGGWTRTMPHPAPHPGHPAGHPEEVRP